jgi:hypothetical protein
MAVAPTVLAVAATNCRRVIFECDMQKLLSVGEIEDGVILIERFLGCHQDSCKSSRDDIPIMNARTSPFPILDG